MNNFPQNSGQSRCRDLVPVVHNTNLASFLRQENGRSSPTSETYSGFQSAYDSLNKRLFSASLPLCLITLQRHSFVVVGYYSHARFGSNEIVGATTDEIALNPIHFKGCDVTEVLQTLAHEMCHLWQWHFGRPSRAGYHNKEWAAKMRSIGLQASSTGKAGGAETGQHMGGYMIAGGAFDLAVQELLQNRFRIAWYDRLAELLERMQQEAVVSNPERPDVAPQLPGRRTKFTCPGCKSNAWGKPSLNLVCGDCERTMLRS